MQSLTIERVGIECRPGVERSFYEFLRNVLACIVRNSGEAENHPETPALCYSELPIVNELLANVAYHAPRSRCAIAASGFGVGPPIRRSVLRST